MNRTNANARENLRTKILQTRKDRVHAILLPTDCIRCEDLPKITNYHIQVAVQLSIRNWACTSSNPEKHSKPQRLTNRNFVVNSVEHC